MNQPVLVTGRHGVGQLAQFQGEALQVLAECPITHRTLPGRFMTRANVLVWFAVWSALTLRSIVLRDAAEGEDVTATFQVNIVLPTYCLSPSLRSRRTNPARMAPPTSQPAAAIDPAGTIASAALRFCTRTRFGLFLSYST